MLAATLGFFFFLTHHHNDGQTDTSKHAPVHLWPLFCMWHDSSPSFSISLNFPPPLIPSLSLRRGRTSPAVVRATGKREEVIEGSKSEGAILTPPAELKAALMHPSA